MHRSARNRLRRRRLNGLLLSPMTPRPFSVGNGWGPTLVCCVREQKADDSTANDSHHSTESGVFRAMKCPPRGKSRGEVPARSSANTATEIRGPLVLPWKNTFQTSFGNALAEVVLLVVTK
ncbi:hypothetical protein CDAR_315941 [Caerostris darwini]|uniref:Uncharacterized protein n=1 Tax=Caerostris darwini TaxID=1538125 RepID=A0AAV4MAX5_9ARAC|nr:hypothetical protein CDAR_315941 [Caerostris darwini]